MAEERNSENFALGIIVAAILFLLFRKEFGKGKTTETHETAQPAISACGCSGASAVQAPPTNPGVSLGNQSYSAAPFQQSTVVPAPKPKVQWYM